MNEQIFDRAPLNSGRKGALNRAIRAIDEGFGALQRIQFAAPWRRSIPSDCRAGR